MADRVWTLFGVLWHLVLLSVTVSGSDSEYTIHIAPGKEECYYQTVKLGEILDVEYQVIDGGHGDLDINFNIVSPTDQVLVVEYKKQDGVHRQEVKEEGDFRVCFDNTFSHISTKVVFFEIIVDDSGNDDSDWDTPEGLFDGVTPEDVFDMSVEELEAAINRVRSNLNRARHMQDQLQAFESRDRNIQEHNFSRVNTWSMVQIALMVMVGLIQVIMVRSLFDDKSRVHRIWKKTSS